jgi:hypothetical protein
MELLQNARKMSSAVFRKVHCIKKEDADKGMRDAVPISKPDQDLTNKETVLVLDKEISRLVMSVNSFVMPAS